MSDTALRYGFRIMGDCTGARRLVDHAAAFGGYAACDEKAEVNSEAYLSAFTFGQDFRDHLERTGTSKGFAGECGAHWLWFDIDRAGDLPSAQADTGRLALAIVERYGFADDCLLVFFSGSKGFHVGLPLSFWTPPPSVDFHRIARRICESLAVDACMEIDTGVYDKVRAFRAPNSRHPKTGLHKRRVSLADLLHHDTSDLLAQAKEPPLRSRSPPRRRRRLTRSGWPKTGYLPPIWSTGSCRPAPSVALPGRQR